MYGKDGRKINFQTDGEVMLHPVSNEFAGGVLTLHDVTTFTNEITEMRKRDEERFKEICNTMPHLVSALLLT
jgi:hypothetical protein